MLTSGMSLAAGFLAGLFVALLVIRRSRLRWLLLGERKAELTHDGWHPLLSAEAWNQPEPSGRHRSPDRKTPTPVEPQPIRPVFYHR